MSHNEVANYYDQPVYGLDTIAGAGLIWYMSRDHLSPPASNEDVYALNAHKWREATSQRIVSLGNRMHIERNDLVLDMGTGIGGPGRDMHIQFGCKVLGINISIAQITALKKISAQQSVDYSRVVNGDMQKLPFQDGVFDKAFSINALYHVSRPDNVMEEAHRVLKPGGKIGLDD